MPFLLMKAAMVGVKEILYFKVNGNGPGTYKLKVDEYGMWQAKPIRSMSVKIFVSQYR